MKKLLLVSTAIAGVALMAAPASAAVKLDLGGMFRGYGAFVDNNEVVGAANSLYGFEFRRDTEFHVSGETTLDNGLTVGAHGEFKIANAANGVVTDEVYAYGSGGWGRVNLGVEDGAAYLLQVAAPSADSNVDGMRVYIEALNPTTTALTGVAADGNTIFNNLNTSNGFGGTTLDYNHADFRNADRLTYLTPKFNGFQGGISYAPHTGITSNTGAVALENDGLGLHTNAGGGDTAADYQDLWEVAARWDGEFQGVGIGLGVGYSDSEVEQTATNAQILALATQDYYLNDGITTWNVGGSLAINGFSLGGSWMTSQTERIAETVAATTTATGDITRETWVVGGAYDNGPYHVGASYLNQETDFDAVGAAAAGQRIAATSFEADKFTVGAGYTFGPGMTFRGAVAWGEFDAPGNGNANDNDFTQITVGTDIQF